MEELSVGYYYYLACMALFSGHVADVSKRAVLPGIVYICMCLCAANVIEDSCLAIEKCWFIRAVERLYWGLYAFEGQLISYR